MFTNQLMPYISSILQPFTSVKRVANKHLVRQAPTCTVVIESEKKEKSVPS